MVIKLDDRRLWGNEAADDEDPEVLNSYFVNRPEWDEFFEPSTRLSIARARKGMGKSALLAECAFRLRNHSSTLIISIKGADLAAQKEFKSLSAIEHVYDWQQRICAVINRSIGQQIGFAISDDSIALVETAELSGFKSRNIVGALIDRLKGKLGPLELQKIAISDNKAILSRFLNDEGTSVCLLIDDIDATFSETKDDSLRLSTFFTACRELAFTFKGITIRTVVRSDVWATIRKHDEALDKVEQYIFDLRWSDKQFLRFLTERILSYCHRIGQSKMVEGKTPDSIISLVFTPRFKFTNWQASPHNTVRLFTGGRPRWAAQLCRMAGAEAIRNGNSDVINLGHIKQVLEAYGRFRLDDVSREHRHQCPTISDIVNCFSKRQGIYTSSELFAFIQDHVSNHVEIKIDGIQTSDPVEISRFLYRTGFIVAMDTGKNENRFYFQFEDKPELLRNPGNYDDGMNWRIHPSLHAALRLTSLD